MTHPILEDLRWKAYHKKIRSNKKNISRRSEGFFRSSKAVRIIHQFTALAVHCY